MGMASQQIELTIYNPTTDQDEKVPATIYMEHLLAKETTISMTTDVFEKITQSSKFGCMPSFAFFKKILSQFWYGCVAEWYEAMCYNGSVHIEDDTLTKLTNLVFQDKFNVKTESDEQVANTINDMIQEATRRGLISFPNRSVNFGYVYLIRLGNMEYYKIGRSNNPDRRIWKEISPKLPEEPEIICVFETTDMIKLEKDLHNRFADKRANGEWFLLDKSDVEYIEGIANE